jgi:4-hydroxy-tetrahydrodipicolinate reductase
MRGTIDMDIAILGDGGLGRAVAAAYTERDDTVRLLGRPAFGRHDPTTLTGVDVLVEASRADAVVANLRAALDAGCERVVLATTGWTTDRPRVDALLREHGAAAVAASNFSLGVVLFGRLVDAAVALFGPLASFDPYLVEWHRRTKRDRPSGTANDLASRILGAHPAKRRVAGGTGDGRPQPEELEVVSLRAGASPGMHLVGFDSIGETVELRLTARDRSAYADGILAAADWLTSAPRPAGLHPFGPVVDELLAGAPVAA